MTINAPLREVTRQLHGKLGRNVHKIDITSVRFSFGILDQIGDIIDEVRSTWTDSNRFNYYLQAPAILDHLEEQAFDRNVLRVLLPYQTDVWDEEESVRLATLTREIAVAISAVLYTLETSAVNIPGADILLNPMFSLTISHPDEHTPDK